MLQVSKHILKKSTKVKVLSFKNEPTAYLFQIQGSTGVHNTIIGKGATPCSCSCAYFIMRKGFCSHLYVGLKYIFLILGEEAFEKALEAVKRDCRFVSSSQDTDNRAQD
jgi:hypothetical protein